MRIQVDKSNNNLTITCYFLVTNLFNNILVFECIQFNFLKFNTNKKKKPKTLLNSFVTLINGIVFPKSFRYYTSSVDQKYLFPDISNVNRKILDTCNNDGNEYILISKPNRFQERINISSLRFPIVLKNIMNEFLFSKETTEHAMIVPVERLILSHDDKETTNFFH